MLCSTFYEYESRQTDGDMVWSAVDEHDCLLVRVPGFVGSVMLYTSRQPNDWSQPGPV